MFNETQVFLFILVNLLTILLVGIVYFIMKDISRIRQGKNNLFVIIFEGVILGGLISIVYVFVSMQISFENDPFWKEINLSYNFIYLSPSLIIIMIFAIMLDIKFLTPMLLIHILTLILLVDWKSIDKTYELVKILFYILSYISILILMFVFYIQSNLIKNNGKKLIVIITLFIVINFIFEMIFYFAFNLSVSEKISISKILSIIFTQISFLSLYSFFQIVIILFVERAYNNFSKLEIFSTRDDISYYKISLSKSTLVKMIGDFKVQTGILILFNIKVDEKVKKEIILDKLKRNLENKYEKSFFFKADLANFGAFFVLKPNFNLEKTLQNNKRNRRTNDDEIEPISREINDISQKYKVKIISSGAIYGVHSYSINDLIEYCKFLMSPIISRPKSNPLIVYDHFRVKSRIKESLNVIELPIDIQGMKISYLRGIYSNNNLFYPLISFKLNFSNKYININDIYTEKNFNENECETILRFTSYQVIRNFEKNKGMLMIYYSTKYLGTNEFIINNFVKKIRRYMNLENLIIGLKINHKNNNKLLEKNIFELRKKGVKFALINPLQVNQEEHDFLNPEFILDIDNEINPLKIKPKSLNIKTSATILNSNLM